MKIFISAAEISSDKHGAKLVQALIAKFSPTKLDIFGIGGPELRAQGIKTIVPAENLLAMGSTEVLVRLPQILIALHRVAEAIKQERPSVAIFLDYPDFHMRLAKK
ncbi:MAG: hypothetical protein HY072_06675 [Deltaproteobacteria bacterium]|nr:hypothetical protein [Deltaproteobacteria bacterium]